MCAKAVVLADLAHVVTGRFLPALASAHPLPYRCCVLASLLAHFACPCGDDLPCLLAVLGCQQQASYRPDHCSRDYVMEFDGDQDYLEVEDTDLLSIEGNITIAAWANFVSFESWNSIVAKSGA